MSRDRRHLPSAAPIASPDGAALKGNATLTGLVKTSRGYATAIVELAPDCSVVAVRLGISQAEKRFVAIEHKREVTKAALRA